MQKHYTPTKSIKSNDTKINCQEHKLRNDFSIQCGMIAASNRFLPPNVTKEQIVTSNTAM